MIEETQNNIPDPTSDETVSKPAINSVRERLVNAVASGTSVQQPTPIPDEAPSPGEKQFIQFVDEKSHELPEEPLTPKKTTVKKVVEKKPSRGSAIRTYHTDVAETIQNQKLSLTNIAVAESERRATNVMPEIEKVQQEKKKIDWKGLSLNALSILLVIAGVGVLSFFYLEYQERAEIDPSIPENTLALANSNITLDLTEATQVSFLNALESVKDTVTGDQNDVINVSLTTEIGTQMISAGEFFKTLGALSDSAFLRSIQEPFMLGLHISDTPHFFLILKTSFFENAFSGMLRWEKTIADELPFLIQQTQQAPILPVLTSSATSSATSSVTSSATSSATSSLPTPTITIPTLKNFEDIVIHNKDVRARRGSDGEIDMLYTFSDPETLIITSNTETLGAILTRLTVARFKQ